MQNKSGNKLLSLATLLALILYFSVAFAQEPTPTPMAAGPTPAAVDAATPMTPAPSGGGPVAVAPVQGATVISTFAPALDEAETDREGAIPDVNVNKIVEKQRELKPELGFEDFFLVKGSTAVLDIQNLGIDTNNICWRQTQIGIIEGGEAEKATGGFRVKVGTSEGSTQLLVYNGKAPDCKILGNLMKVYRVTVSGQNLVILLQEMKAMIGNVEGLEMKIVGSQIVVDGQVLIPKDMRRVLAVLANYQAQNKPILNLVEISPLTMKLLAEKMEEEIAGGKDRPKDIKVKVVNGRFFLEGNVDKRVDRETAQKICESYVSEKYTLESSGAKGGKLEKINFPSLTECVMMVRIRAGQAKDPDPIISVRVDFVTINRSYLKSFDFRWAPGVDLEGDVSYQSDTGKFLSTFTGTIANLFPKLDTAKQHGHARILKTLTVLVRDGDGPNGEPADATINETLNIGYTIPASGNNPAQQASTPVTTRIKVKARSIPGSDKLNMGVDAVQTELRSQDSNGAPTTLANSVSTQLVVPNGESAALGGLVAERRNVDFGRAPSSGAGISVFDLDRKHQFKDEKSQFIIFVTPTKLRSTTEGTDTLKRKFRLRK